MMSQLKNNFLIKVFIFSFCYAASVAVAVQFWILPHVFPQLNDGNGLIKNTDAVAFHHWAIEIAQKIRDQGWSSWHLVNPDFGSAPNLAGALYAIFIPKPWVLIPFNATIHALSLVVLMLIYLHFFNKKQALFAALPYLILPSALIWYAQIHHDGYYFLGVFLILLFWICLSELPSWSHPFSSGFMSFIFLQTGAFLMWLARPITIRLGIALSLVVFIALSACFILQMVQRRLSLSRFGSFVFLSLVSLAPLTQLTFHARIVNPAEFKPIPLGKGQPELEVATHWSSSPLLPHQIDEAFRQIADFRNSSRTYILTNSSQIDNDVTFRRTRDVLYYTPRALEVGFLAPFPNSFFKEGKRFSSKLFRLFSLAEMLVVYLGLLFLIFQMTKKSAWKPAAMVLLIWNTLTILFITVAYNNLGAIYRYRYGNLMVVVGLGFGFLASALARARSRGRRKKLLAPSSQTPMAGFSSSRLGPL